MIVHFWKLTALRLITLFTLLIPAVVLAQVNITGRILDKTNNQPIPNVNVFLNNATIGDKTNSDGKFSLQKVTPGKYDLVVSIVGFTTYNQSITIADADIKLADITITPNIKQLKEVKISPVTDFRRDQYYLWFKQGFLGTSDAAKDCKISNPEMLDFSYDDVKSRLTASSVDFLQIKNEDLGYNIKYLLSDFAMDNPGKLDTQSVAYHGFVMFEELKGSPSQERRWREARQEAFENSSMHFLRSLLTNRVKEEGFMVQLLSIYANPERPADSIINAKIKFYNSIKSKTSADRDSASYWTKKSKLKKKLIMLNPVTLSAEEIVQKTDQPGLFALGCENDGLYITYNQHHVFEPKGTVRNVNDRYNTDKSIVSFNTPYAYFDSNGWITNPESITYSGVWAKDRVALLLPENYGETGNKSVSDTSGVLSGISKKLETFAKERPVEKVYLQLDKSNYDLQDTIWYKAYTVVGEHHQLSALSGVLYVELAGPGDTVISRQILHLNSGTAWGGLVAPDKAKPGDYHIRAYTNWMRNAGPAYFYNQQIHIGGYETTSAPKVASAKPDVQFFPEGGWLVNGLRSKVAIKSVGVNGYGLDVKGTVEDNDGNVVVDFATRHLGMGVFAFTPQNGKSYKARISAGETAFMVTLPVAKDEGYTLGINNSEPDSIFIKVATNDALFKQKQHSKFYITAQSAGKVYYAATGNLDDKIFTSSVDKKRFPSGIVQFTLFAENGEPLNERSAFVQNDDTLKLHIDANTANATRAKVKITLDAKNKASQSTAGAFSVAVINESIGINDETREGTILNKLLLTSDLKGYIEQPNYYFINPGEQTAADLDVLMLTQAYQRYEWKQVLKDSLPAIAYQSEDALELTGSVKTLSGKPIPNGKIDLIATRYKLLADTITDSNGNFRFYGLDLPDSAKLVLSAKKINNSNNVKITITPRDYPPVIKQAGPNGTQILTAQNPPATPAPGAAMSSQQQQLADLNKERQLKGVTIKGHSTFKREQPNLSNSANRNGAGNADQVITADQLKGCVTLSDCLTGLVNGVNFIKPSAVSNVVIVNTRRHGMHESPVMALIIDGAVSNGTSLDDINPDWIQSIEVLRSKSQIVAYGIDIGGGALVITTKHSGDKDYASLSLSPGTINYTFKGFYKVQEFYSPKYDSPKNNTTIPDLRSTIYWNPNVTTDKDGKASFEYFNADTKGTYRVVVEGIDGDGNLGRQVYRYKVE